MNEKIDRVAKALYWPEASHNLTEIGQEPGTPDSLWEKLPERGRVFWRSQAKQAIEAMSEPPSS